MEHHFSIKEAVEHGVEEAILIHNIRFWLEKNMANNKHAYEVEKGGKEYYWTYNSARAFSEMFPYMSEDTIQRKLKGLEAKGIILSGNFNKTAYDRTKWYTLPQEYEIQAAELRDGKVKNAEPIPYSKPDGIQIMSEADEISFLKEEEIQDWDEERETEGPNGNWITVKYKDNKPWKPKTLFRKANITTADKITAKPYQDKQWSYQAGLEKMAHGATHEKILSLYFQFKGWKFENQEQMSKEAQRALKAAIALKGYHSPEVIQTMRYIDSVANEEGFKWSLETVGKYIADVVSGKLK